MIHTKSILNADNNQFPTESNLLNATRPLIFVNETLLFSSPTGNSVEYYLTHILKRDEYVQK